MFAPMANSRITCICGAIYEVINWRTGGQTEWKLPARRPLEGDDRALEAHQIASLMSAFGAKADISEAI